MNNLLSVKQVAFILKVHPLTVRRYIREKRLKAVKVGGNIRIEENALQEMNKDVEQPQEQNRIFKKKTAAALQFTDADPFLRLQGRGASLKLS